MVIEMEQIPRKLRRPRKPPRICFWVKGLLDGEPQLLGPYDSYNEAEEHGFSGFKNSPYRIFPLNTSNRPEAVRRLRHVKFEESGDLRESTKPMHHTLQRRI